MRMGHSGDRPPRQDPRDVAYEIVESLRTMMPIIIASDPDWWMRTAINRLYYAAFLCLRNSFRADPELSRLVRKRRGIHAFLLGYLYSNLPLDMRHFANDFKELKRARELADYAAPGEYTADMSDVESAIEAAVRIISNTPQIIASLKRPGP